MVDYEARVKQLLHDSLDSNNHYTLFEDYFKQLGTGYFNAYKNIFNKKKRVRYCNKKLFSMVESYPRVYFLTLTFSNDYLSKTSEGYRKRALKEILNEARIKDYILNVDYGDLFGREHYHAVIGTNSLIEMLNLIKIYYKKTKSFLFYERVRLQKDKGRKLARYLTKLERHGFKVCNKLIYSRGGNCRILSQKQQRLKDMLATGWTIKTERDGWRIYLPPSIM